MNTNKLEYTCHTIEQTPKWHHHQSLPTITTLPQPHTTKYKQLTVNDETLKSIANLHCEKERAPTGPQRTTRTRNNRPSNPWIQHTGIKIGYVISKMVNLD